MRHKISNKAKQISKNPAVKKAVKSMKPARNIWGISGVIFFFILPEIIAFVWGEQITAYAREQLAHNLDMAEHYYYEGLVMLFEDGMSWINLLIGIALLVWLFF
ncbi:MAG: hypothetical protein B5M52_07025 [Helicobacteraceae bacterium 4484_230]|nr:MAG: hypothetical protein B5M52_07025 [Helicobacteraceae bacterium 4484_230]